MLKLAPHWNWPADSVGKSIKVIAMTNADSVALFLNGKMLNSKKIAKYELPEWQVSYQTGKLEAKGYKNGKLIATDFVETTGEAIALQLIPDRKVLLGNGDDALPITVQALDKKGRVVPNANFLVKFDINGPAKNIGVGNGDPVSHESEKENQRMLYNGLAQLIIQSDEGRKGLVTVKASAEGMKEAVIQLIVTETAQIPAVKAVPKAMFVSNWLSSPVSKQRPDPLVQIADFDMNTWTNTTAGNVQYLDKNHYVIWRAKFTPTENVQNNGGFLVLKQLVGVSEIWINGNLIIKNELPRKDDLRLKLTPKSGETVVNILFKGLYGRVGIETLVSVTE
jgi:beta-galactosidase